MTTRIGITGRPRRPGSEAGLDLVELRETFEQVVRPKTLAEWRNDLPDGLRLVVRAAREVTHPRDPATGHFRATEPVEQAWGATVAAARSADALAVVFRTPASFTPISANLEALRRFGARAAADLDGTRLIWEPVGIWEDDEAAAVAAEAGMVLAVDPLVTPPPQGEVAFCRMSGPNGVRGRYDDLDLEAVLDLLEGRELALVLFDHSGAMGDARRMVEARDGREED